MRTTWFIAPFVVIGLSGCATQLTHQAREKLQAQCAAKGMQFVETSSRSTEMVVAAQAEVSGECVGPGDPRYVDPQKPPAPSQKS
jgi:hypothetical protein